MNWLKFIVVIVGGMLAIGAFVFLGWLAALLVPRFLWRDWFGLGSRLVGQAHTLGRLSHGVLAVLTFFILLGGFWSGLVSALAQGNPTRSPTAVVARALTSPAGTNSRAQELVLKMADGNGMVSWSWVIGPNTRPGTGTVTVTCNGVSASTGIQIG